MKFLRLFAALPLCILGFSSANLTAHDLTTPEQLYPQLDVILKQAVAQSPRMIRRAADLEIAENDRIGARAGLLPSVGGYYAYYKSHDKQELLYDNPANSSSQTYTLTKTPYALSIAQPLFYWGERKNSAKIGEINQSIAEGQYREGYRLLAQTLRGEYLRLIILKLSTERARYYQAYASDQLKQDQDKLTKKVISEAEIFGTQVAADRADIARDRAEADLDSALRSFNRLAGSGTNLTEADIPANIPKIAANDAGLEALMKGFLAQKDTANPEAITLRKQLEIENLNYKISRTRLLPKVSLSAGLTQDEQNNYFGQGARYSVNSAYAGVSLNWVLFDGFAAGAAQRNSLARRRQLEGDYRQLTERLATDAGTQVKQIGFSVRSMAITERLLESSEGNLRVREEEHGRGVRSDSEVSLAKLGLYDAQLNALSARREYLISVGDFLGLVVEDPVLGNIPKQ
ncbi:MAG: TolC family protein [Lacunisphaera sp.]